MAIARGVIISRSIITTQAAMDGGAAAGVILITTRSMIRGIIHGTAHGTPSHTTIHIGISRTIHIMVTTVIMATTDIRIILIIIAVTEQAAERAHLAARAAAE